MGATRLPGRCRRVRRDRLDQTLVGVGGDEADPSQAAGDEVGEELVPGRAGLAGRDAHAQDLPAPVRVLAGREHHDRVDDAAAFADLHRQGVGGDERERARVAERPVAELVDMLVEIRGHPRHLRPRQRVDPELLDELVHPPRTHPGEVTVRDDRDQRGLGPLTALEQPVREVSPLPQLRDRDIDGPDPGVQVAVPVAVALRDTVRGRLAPFGADDSVRVRGQQRVDHRLQQLAHQIRRRVGQGFAEQAGRVDNMRSGHRDDSIRVRSRELSRRITR